MNDRDEITTQDPRERSGTAMIADVDDRDEPTPEVQARDEGQPVDAPTPRDEVQQAKEVRARDEVQRPDTPLAEQDDAASMPLFSADAGEGYQQRWQEVQSRFVDDPPTAVQDADQLIADLMQDLARSFNKERTQLEETWKGGGEVSTEELRLALRRYRSFFGRLLSM